MHFLQKHQASSDDISNSNDSGMDSSGIPSKIEEKSGEKFPNSLPLGNSEHDNQQVVSPRANSKASPNSIEGDSKLDSIFDSIKQEVSTEIAEEDLSRNKEEDNSIIVDSNETANNSSQNSTSVKDKEIKPSETK